MVGYGDVQRLPGRSKQMVRQAVCSLMLFWLMQGELEGQARAVQDRPRDAVVWVAGKPG